MIPTPSLNTVNSPWQSLAAAFSPPPRSRARRHRARAGPGARAGTRLPRSDAARLVAAEPVQYPDPDIVALDNRFRRYIVGNTSIKRLHIGHAVGRRARPGTASGRYLVWSDIPNNVQMRWIEEDGRVTVFRNPSGYSNGNTFDFEGRQLSCEHGGRRVVRYEHERHASP